MFDGMQDTIAAISTAVSEAGIGIVRISGPELCGSRGRRRLRRPILSSALRVGKGSCRRLRRIQYIMVSYVNRADR